MDITQIALICAVGLLAGTVSGCFGVGGGMIEVPALVFFLGFSKHMAQGTSLAMMVAPIGILSAMNYYKGGYVDIKVALIMLIAFFVGSYFGSYISVQLSAKIVKRLFGVLMLVAAIKMIIGK